MELYTLDSLFRRERIFDQFESLIWTERFSAYGDFELVVPSTNETRSAFRNGVYLAQNKSFRVMKIDTIEDSADDQGKATLKVSGTSFEEHMDDRAALAALGSTTTYPKWVINATPGGAARSIFHDICIAGTLSAQDIIPGVMEGSSLFPTDTIPEPEDYITIGIDPTTVYTAVKQICDIYKLGFRIVRNPITSQLYFDVYSGCDRTTGQTLLDPVIFSKNLDNLQSTTELLSTLGSKNTAYVISPSGYQIVYADGVDPLVEGFDRRVMVVKVDDVTDTDAGIWGPKLYQRGKEELAKNRILYGFDGELDQNADFVYGTDYNLGDLVEMQNLDGATNKMRVTEQIFVSDKEGDRSYPTLTIDQFILPGTWLAWEYSKVWLDYDSDPITWSEL